MEAILEWASNDQKMSFWGVFIEFEINGLDLIEGQMVEVKKELIAVGSLALFCGNWGDVTIHGEEGEVGG